MPDKDKEKKKKPIPWEIKDPGIPSVSSIVSPVDLGSLPPAAPDLQRPETRL